MIWISYRRITTASTVERKTAGQQGSSELKKTDAGGPSLLYSAIRLQLQPLLEQHIKKLHVGKKHIIEKAPPAW
jgi:hypothetical protein